jgi:membrane protease subunit HflK
MAWNQPGDDNRRPAARGAPESASLDEMLRRWQERVQRLWRPGSNRTRAALALVALAAAVWLASGYYQIGASERGVVQSFGRYVSTELPGSGWHWPWPIQTLTKLNVEALDSVDARAVMLTSDQGLISLGWSVQYRVLNPWQYLFQVRDPLATLRQASETVIRQLTAGDALQSLLSGDARVRLGGQARERVQQVLDRYGAGIAVSSVSLTDVQLPDPVVAAQHDAQRAADERKRALADAQTYADDLLLKAQASAQQQVSDAQVYATQALAQAQADADRFTQLAGAYALSPQVMRDRLYIQTIEGILAGTHKIFVDAREGTTISLPLDKLAEQMRSSAPHASGAATSAAAIAPPPPSERQDSDRSRDRGER